MSLHLDFLNKNMYRKYPIRATSTHIFTDGTEFLQSILVALQVSVPYAYRSLYISKVFVKQSYISITLRDVATDLPIGCFSGTLSSNFQVIPMTSFINTVSGTITFGNIDALTNYNGVYYFSTADGQLEDSTIFCFTPPGVTAIENDGDSITGNINLVPENINITEEDNNILLSVINVSSILSNNDSSGESNNCPTPIIKKINTVSPNPVGCNIDIYGILPVQIEVDEDGAIVGIDAPDLTLADVCPEKDQFVPPEDETTDYYTDILTTTDPEWKTWPQFLDE